jgi:hypothetical protein
MGGGVVASNFFKLTRSNPADSCGGNLHANDWKIDVACNWSQFRQ